MNSTTKANVPLAHGLQIRYQEWRKINYLRLALIIHIMQKAKRNDQEMES